jgi:hypothetical protein
MGLSFGLGRATDKKEADRRDPLGDRSWRQPF